MVVALGGVQCCVAKRRDGACPLMEWSGRAPAPPAIEAGKGRQRRGARHVSAERPGCRCRHRYRQELVPHCWSGRPRRDFSAAKVDAGAIWFIMFMAAIVIVSLVGPRSRKHAEISPIKSACDLWQASPMPREQKITLGKCDRRAAYPAHRLLRRLQVRAFGNYRRQRLGQ